MAIKRSVVQIEVQDEKWKAYMASFAKYETLLKGMPAAWKKMAESGQGHLQTMQKMTTSLQANADAFRKVAVNQTDMTERSRQMAASWKDIVKSTKDSAVNTYNQVTSLLRATGIITAVTGLATGGALFGLDRLAAAASNDRRTALGLGVPTGKSAAFAVGFGRAIDTQGFLHGVARARGSMTSNAAIAMRIMGMDPRAKGDTGEVSDALLERIRAIALKAKETGEYGLAVQTNRTEEFGVGTEDLRRVGEYSPEEWQEFIANKNKAKQQLGIGDPTQKKWEDFYVQLGFAADKLKTGLINGLEKLTVPLANLTDKLSDFVLQFVSSSGFKMVIEDFAKGLDWAAKYVSSDDFKHDLEGFGNSMKGLYQGLQEFVAFFSSPIWQAFKIANNIASAPAKMAGVTVQAGKNVYDWATGGGKTAAGGAYVGAGQPGAAGLDAFFGGTPGKSGGVGLSMPGATGSSISTRYATESPASGDAKQWRAAISGIESGGNYGAVNPTSGAMGRYQVMPANLPSWSQQALGHSITRDEFLANPQFQDKIFDTIFGGYVKRYGSVELAARAWYAGEGGMWNTSANDKATGGSGISVGDYGRRAAGGGATGAPASLGAQGGGADARGVKVVLQNNTGGATIPIVSQMGIVPGG